MIISKVLNNNLVLSIEPKTKNEVILMGCGIAFQKKPGDAVDTTKIEKKFSIEDGKLGNRIKELLSKIPEGIFSLSNDIIIYSEKTLNRKLDKQIYISLSDHIAFALKRYKKGIIVKNSLLHEIKRVHKEEYKIGVWAVDYINKRAKIELPIDEAGFIALHIVNASYNNAVEESLALTEIVNGILNIIRYTFSIEFNEEELSYERLITHLKFFARRVITNNQYKNEENNFLDIVKESYKDEYECVLKISKFIKATYNYDVKSDEIVYLTMHIHRVISVIKENIQS